MGEAGPPSPRSGRAWLGLKGTEISKAFWPVATQGFSETRRPEMVSGILAFGLSGIWMTNWLPVFSVLAAWNSST